MNKKSTAEFYNSFFKKESFSKNSLNIEELRRWNVLEVALDALVGKKDHCNRGDIKLLDFGCGDGRFIPLLQEYGEVDGIDLADEAMKRGECVIKHVNWYEGDLGVDNINTVLTEKYDYVVSTEVVEHIEDLKKETFFLNLSRVTKSGGFVILTTPNALVKNHHFSGPRKKWKQLIEDWIFPDDLISEMEKSGFSILKYETFYLEWILERYPKTWLNIFFNSYFVPVYKKIGLDKMILQVMKKFNLGLYQLVVARKE